jgi:hypothetical protein
MAPYRDVYGLFKLSKQGASSVFDTLVIGRFRSSNHALIYKYDWLAPDSDYFSGQFSRHGLGWRWGVRAPHSSAAS